MSMNNKSAKYLYEKVRARGGIIASSPEELATHYRPGKIHGNLLEYIKNGVELHGYNLCTHFSSINGETIWYFEPSALV